jgi:hypothetical protein
MKRIWIPFIIGAAVFIIACQAQKKAQYEFPEGMLPHVREEYAKRCDQGQILYNINCGKCHNTRVNGRTVIPDFNPEQLTGYTLRVSNANHESSMPDSLVSEEELVIIMTFLNYKKKNPPAREKDS